MPRSPGLPRSLRSTLLGFLLVTVWLGFGAVVAWNADGARWSATLLLGEPALLVAAALVGVALARRRAALPTVGWILGIATFFLLVRVPRAGSSQVGSTPAWINDAQKCSAELDLPTSPFRILQWTLDPSVGDADIAEVVRRADADVVLLYDLPRTSALEAVDEVLGGESIAVGAPTPIGLATRGALHLCGDAAILVPGRDHPNHALAFVGAHPGVSFPLLFGSMPPLDDTNWADAARDERMALGSIAGALQSSKLVVAIDSRGPWTWTRLNARLAAVGLRLAWSSPDWPRRLGPVPWLPMHAMQRLWTGSAWRPGLAGAVRADAGTRAPVVHLVDAAVHSASASMSRRGPR